jgi:acetyl-CoA carboxylase carboxyltransferase component
VQAKVSEIALSVIAKAGPEAACDALRAQFLEAARAQIEIARGQGPEAVEELQARLFSELGNLFADPEAMEETEESDEVVKQKLVRTNFSENLQKPEQNQNSDFQALDTGVQSCSPLRAVPPSAVKQDSGPSPPRELVYETEGFD